MSLWAVTYCYSLHELLLGRDVGLGMWDYGGACDSCPSDGSLWLGLAVDYQGKVTPAWPGD